MDQFMDSQIAKVLTAVKNVRGKVHSTFPRKAFLSFNLTVHIIIAPVL